MKFRRDDELSQKNMNYQLILQVNNDSLGSFDAMVNLEGELSIALNSSENIDIHNMGCGEIYIFILTSNPVFAFEQAKKLLEKHKLLHDAKAGFRLLCDDIYITIWPENATSEFLAG